MGKRPLEKAHCLAYCLYISIGPEIPGTVFLHPPHYHHPWKRLLKSHFYIGIRFVILEPDIIPRRISPFQVALQDQGFDFGIGNDVFKIGNMINQGRHFGRAVAAGLEIRAHPIAGDTALPT